MSASHFSRTLKRNCSTSPAALAAVFVALAGVVLVIGAGFAVAGAWLVLPFAGLEVLLLTAAYLAYARHAADYERVELSDGKLTIEVGDGMRTRHREMPAYATTVRLEEKAVVLRSAGEELEIGRHLDEAARAELAAELRRQLRT